ncbi:MAG: hypothetical protein OEV91_01995 [Desulfobulbaceae bacterium]|nr:hypothetical protein [Desulfobulbaceae bacterium]
MTMTKSRPTVKRRKAQHVARTVTKIWYEKPTAQNPYLAERCYCYGYDLHELIRQKSFVDVFFLLFAGELPSQEQSKLLEALMIGLINSGPRHPATRAAMNAAVGKARHSHILPIGLSVLGGAHSGGDEVEQSMRFLRKATRRTPEDIAAEIKDKFCSSEEDFHIVPGFGTRFGGRDPMPHQLAAYLASLPGSGEAIQWGEKFAARIAEKEMGWLDTGVAAATLCDLGFLPKQGAGLYQLLRAPGILAHGQELSNKPITAMPFLSEENYVIAKDAQKK